MFLGYRIYKESVIKIRKELERYVMHFNYSTNITPHNKTVVPSWLRWQSVRLVSGRSPVRFWQKAKAFYFLQKHLFNALQSYIKLSKPNNSFSSWFLNRLFFFLGIPKNSNPNIKTSQYFKRDIDDKWRRFI